MFALSEGQQIARDALGVAPVAWGWLIAVAFALGALVAAVAPWPASRPAGSPPPEEPSKASVDRWTLATLIFALVLHAPGHLGSFNLFDDQRQIPDDPVTTNPSLADVWRVIFENYRGKSQELMYISFQANWALFGDNYAGWYVFNWLLLVPILLLVARLTVWITGSRAAGPLAAALFATAPILPEQLCWMSARSHLYGLTLMLASLVAWASFRAAEPPHRWRWYVASVLAFAGSQLAKPIFVFLPAWLVLLDLYEGRRDVRAIIAEKVPFALVAAAFLYKLMRHGDGQRIVRSTPLGGSYVHTVLQDLNLLVEYGRSLFIPTPTGLLPAYNVAIDAWSVEGIPMVRVNGFAPAASALILLAVGAAVYLAWRRAAARLPALWLAGCLVSVAMVMNIPFRGDVATFEYRYTLSAHVLTAALLASGAVLAWRSAWGQRHSRWLVSLGAAYLVIRASTTLDHTVAWRTSEDYWLRNTALYPFDEDAHYYAGKALQRVRRFEEAYAHLQEAQRLGHPTEKLSKRLGDVAYDLGRHDEARAHWAVYFERHPDQVTDRYQRRFTRVGLDLGASAPPLPAPRPPGPIRDRTVEDADPDR